MGEKVTFEIWTSERRPEGQVPTDVRVPKQHVGWRSVTYKGDRYKLYGGYGSVGHIRLSEPIRERARRG